MNFYTDIQPRLSKATILMDTELMFKTIREWKLRYYQQAKPPYFIADYPSYLQKKLIDVLRKRHGKIR